MKKIIAFALVLLLCASLFAGCGAKKATLEGTPAEIIEKIYAEKSVEFAPWTLTPDDPDYGSMWDWTYYTGLADGSQISEAAVSAIWENAAENVRKFANMGGLLAPGSDAGAWSVPHDADTEHTLLTDLLGADADSILARGTAAIQQKF